MTALSHSQLVVYYWIEVSSFFEVATLSFEVGVEEYKLVFVQVSKRNHNLYTGIRRQDTV